MSGLLLGLCAASARLRRTRRSHCAAAWLHEGKACFGLVDVCLAHCVREDIEFREVCTVGGRCTAELPSHASTLGTPCWVRPVHGRCGLLKGGGASAVQARGRCCRSPVALKFEPGSMHAQLRPGQGCRARSRPRQMEVSLVTGSGDMPLPRPQVWPVMFAAAAPGECCACVESKTS